MLKEHGEQPVLLVSVPVFEQALLSALAQKNLTITTWNVVDSHLIYESLEHPNWAPWLEASPESIAGRAAFFPEGQILLVDEEGTPAASLSINQIDWDGDPDTLPTWDDIAGDPADYSQTYNPHGNTLVLMSMNVNPDFQGQRLPEKLVKHVQVLAHQLGVQHIVGSFRPSEYGINKKEHQGNLEFWYYVTQMTTPRLDKKGVFGEADSEVHLPLDAWLRSLAWLGMQPLVEDEAAMTVTVPLGEFKNYQKSYKPDSWWQDDQGVWHSSEVGSWKINEGAGTATYVESNVFGLLPILVDIALGE